MTDSLELDVNNVKCGGCAQSICDGLRPLSGIDHVDVIVESGRVIIKGSNFSVADIQARLAELGFPVKGK
ncbi:MAG: heavy-metal-associated domain-containing protein [Gammaproteobacteria bacterium]|nr:heavy-metal-associated domain-containing protein [Gammaproteobacteria bacterium]